MESRTEWPSMSDSTGRAARLDGRPLDALVMTVGEGDADAFERLYREIAGPVYHTALSVLRDPAHAEEVAEEVLLEVWRTAARFDPARGTAEAWVLTMARR